MLTASRIVSSRRYAAAGCVASTGEHRAVIAAVEDGLLMLLSDGAHCSFVPATWHDHSHFPSPHGEHSADHPATVPVPSAGVDLLSSTEVTDQILLAPLGAAVIRIREAATDADDDDADNLRTTG